MKEFAVQGSLTLEGVWFYITAETMAGALGKLAMGDYDTYDLDDAHTVGHHVALSSIEETT